MTDSFLQFVQVTWDRSRPKAQSTNSLKENSDEDREEEEER